MFAVGKPEIFPKSTYGFLKGSKYLLMLDFEERIPLGKKKRVPQVFFCIQAFLSKS